LVPAAQAAKVKSNQFLFLNVPSVSYFSCHPISIAAFTPGADNLSQDVVLHLKAYGSWSRVSPGRSQILLFSHIKQTLDMYETTCHFKTTT